jgi:hypothetical protein
MRYAVSLLAVAALSVYAAEPKPIPDPERARLQCKDAPPVMKHPADLEKAKRDAFDRCMAKKGVHTRVIRAK